jgi:DNA topoisomerase III
MANCIATVKHCNERPTSRIRPVPLNLIALQKLASTWFRLSGEDTLNIAQKLYQEGILSYPRTETNFFAEDIELQALLGLHREHNSWGAYTRRLLDSGGFVWPLHGGLSTFYYTLLVRIITLPFLCHNQWFNHSRAK